MARPSRAQGAYRLGGILLLAGGLSALFFGISQNQILNMALLGLVSTLTGLYVLASGKGEAVGLGLSMAGSALMVYFLIDPPRSPDILTTLANILRWLSPIAYALSLLVFILGSFMDRK